MASSYPTGYDALTNPTASDNLDSVTVPHATQHADANDAIEAIQGELGLEPSGASATVKARLDTLDSTVGGKSDTGHTHSYEAVGVAAALVDDLSGVSNAATARTNLGLGGAAVLAVGTTAGTVAAGDDSRLSDARTPTAHVHAGTDITSGTVAFARLPVGTTSTTVSQGDHSHAGGSLTVQDENGNVGTGVTQIDFQGAGVAATAGSGEIVVTIGGGGSTDYTALARTFQPLARIR